MKPSATQAIVIFDYVLRQLGPKYLAYWVLPNTVLTLSGARAYCDGVFWDVGKKELLKQWDREIAEASDVLKSETRVIWSETGIKEARLGEKYASYDFIFETGLHYVLGQTKLLSGDVFDNLKKLTSAEEISKSLVDNLKSQTRFKSFSNESLSHIAFGILMGYPDKAILGAVANWGSDDKFSEHFIDANIIGADYYDCPQPVYSYPRELIDDTSIVAHEKLWSKILKSYYTSDFHKSLEADKAFRQKLTEIGS